MTTPVQDLQLLDAVQRLVAVGFVQLCKILPLLIGMAGLGQGAERAEAASGDASNAVAFPKA